GAVVAAEQQRVEDEQIDDETDAADRGELRHLADQVVESVPNTRRRTQHSRGAARRRRGIKHATNTKARCAFRPSVNDFYACDLRRRAERYRSVRVGRCRPVAYARASWETKRRGPWSAWWGAGNWPG